MQQDLGLDLRQPWVSWRARFLSCFALYDSVDRVWVELRFAFRVNVGCSLSPHLERVRPWNYFRGSVEFDSSTIRCFCSNSSAYPLVLQQSLKFIR
jgi:hypothetical protein